MIQYLTPTPRPEGYRRYQDVIREIADAEGLQPTGWHYREEPDAAEIEYKSKTHHGGAVLIARNIVSDEERDGWTLFMSSEAGQ